MNEACHALCRYLTTTTAEKHRSNLLGNKLGREVRSSKVKQEQKAKPSGLQQEIVEAALMQEVHAQAAESLDNLTASNVPLHTPQVVSAFSEASQSQVGGSIDFVKKVCHPSFSLALASVASMPVSTFTL